jgi:hypothetical protein
MKFAGWYLKIAAVGASIGAAMELFMIHTGFCRFLPPCSAQHPTPLTLVICF